MADNNNFDFGAFNMNNSGGGDNFNSFWERDSVKDDNNSFFSDQSNKQKKKSQKSNKQMNFESKVQSQVISQGNQISLGAFGDPESPSQMKSSGISQRFNVQKQSQQDYREAAINLSRSIGQIDVHDFEKINGGYHFQKQVPKNYLNKDDNYEILKKYLNEPKKMNFDKFFTDLQKNQDVSNSSFLNKSEYRNMEQYQQFKRKLKLQKRYEQQKRQNQIVKREGSEVNGAIAVPKIIQINYFKKKPYSNNAGDEDIITFNVDQKLQYKQPLSSGFISLKSKPTKDKPSQKAKSQNQIDFFESEIKNSIESFESKKSNRQPSLQKSKLPMIVDADENIFQTTQQEMKLNNLFNNFKNLMENYNLLRGELKSNTEGHQKIMKQLNCLKDDYNKKQQEYDQKVQPKVVKEDQLVAQHQVISLNKEEAKQKINQIQLDIFKKIENLQNVVKQTFDRDNDQNNNLVWVNPDFKEQSERSIKQTSRSKINSPITHQHYQSIQRQNDNQQILSPLDLRLNINQTTVDYYGNITASPSKAKTFSPQPKKIYQGLCHQPQHMSVDNFFRNVCVNDNTIVFQSFDFIVTAKYSFVRTGRKHLRISITVKNKTILCLNDFMVIMYGSVGQVLQISPSKMFVQKFGPEQLKSLEAIVDSIKVGGQPIRMQISYRTQRDRKGKVSIKIPRPITKFMDIKFTHESQFNEIFSSAKHQLYLLPKNLNFQLIKSTDDIKLIFPFIQINQSNERQFSYGLVFSILNIEGIFLLKLVCSIDGTAQAYLKFDDENMIGHGKQMLDILNLIMFS